MSRPQYYQQSMPHVVNGGLIDFRDNMHTGTPEYSALMSSNACMYPTPGMPSPATLGPFHGQGAGMGCVSGPPSYMQINGITYRPVEEGMGTEACGKSSLRGAEVAPKEEPVKVLSEAELERAIDNRVHQRVEEFLSTRRHPRARHEDRDYERAEPCRTEPDARSLSFEEEAAKRLKGLNATMKKGGRG